MAEEKYKSYGPIYLSQAKYDELDSEGEIVAGQEYCIVSSEGLKLDYLPLSGGTMTGSIINANDGAIVKAKDTLSSVAIYGGTSSTNGATLTLTGKDSEYNGAFAIMAENEDSEGNIKTSSLTGSADGKLYWVSNHNRYDILTSNNTSVSSEGTSTNVAKYITIDGTEYKLSGGTTGNYLPLAGGTMSGSILMNGNTIASTNGNGHKNLYLTSDMNTAYASTSLTLGGMDGGYAFVLESRAGIGYSAIALKGDGYSRKLTWGNKDVLHAGNTYISSEGTSTNVAKYITIDDTQYKLPEGVKVKVSDTGTSTTSAKYITTDSTEYKINQDVIIDVTSLPTSDINENAIYRMSYNSLGTLLGRYSRNSSYSTVKFTLKADSIYVQDTSGYRWAYMYWKPRKVDSEGKTIIESASIGSWWDTPINQVRGAAVSESNSATLQQYTNEDSNGSIVRFTNKAGQMDFCYIDTWNATAKYAYYIYKSGIWFSSKVEASTTGTSTTEAKYITIGDTEYKLAGSGVAYDSASSSSTFTVGVDADGKFYVNI